MKISVLIITYNEEINLDICLKYLDWCDDIVILDSFSDDRTVEIAKKYSVRIIQRKFDNFANQRNYGLKNISYKYSWLLMLDADEIVSENLKDEIGHTLSNNDCDISLYYMRRKDFFWKKWIKYSSGYPTWFGRLMRIGDVYIERDINEQYKTCKQVGYLKNHLYHYPFRKGIDHWINKHNMYSTLESNIYIKDKILVTQFFSDNPTIRRNEIKKLIYKMPARPLIYFFIIYFLRKGFLDGIPGLHFCILKTIYEYFICCKTKNNKIMMEILK
jgi:glycosyltransferase involved in cell wall biosynthesis